MGDKIPHRVYGAEGSFQPTPTHGGRHERTHAPQTGEGVSTHAHARWATPQVIAPTGNFLCFNPRPRTVGDRYVQLVQSGQWAFQPTPTHGGRRTKTVPPWSIACCFNPRPRTVGDQALMGPSRSRFRFQPTPTHGGRRLEHVELDDYFHVSTHAHARWATAKVISAMQEAAAFQPTPTHGGRRDPRGDARLGNRCFNPRPRTVGDIEPLAGQFFGAVFQPTPTHGGRLEKVKSSA